MAEGKGKPTMTRTELIFALDRVDFELWAQYAPWDIRAAALDRMIYNFDTARTVTAWW